jgi:hypothetical protein
MKQIKEEGSRALCVKASQDDRGLEKGSDLVCILPWITLQEARQASFREAKQDWKYVISVTDLHIHHPNAMA